MGLRTFDAEVAWAAGCPKRKPFWVWLAEEYEALEVLELLWPWLTPRRRSQAMDYTPLEAIHLDASNADWPD